MPARICARPTSDALRATRPYRPGLSADRILDIMGREVGTGIDADCYAALRDVLLDSGRAQRRPWGGCT